MPVDNTIYDRMANTWWDEKGFLYSMRTALNPGRFGYFQDVLINKLKRQPEDKQVLDIRCEGGLLADEFARLGFKVTGIDPSISSIESAKEHAEQTKLNIDYHVGSGEDIPFDDGSFDIVYSCDTLEHVTDLEKVIAEAARVLKKGGIFFYDTINRTFRSKIVFIKLLQEWKWTSFVPPNLHDWEMFIPPKRLHEIMSSKGIHNLDTTGLIPDANPLQLIRILRKHKRGDLTYAEAGQQMKVKITRDVSLMYMGYGIKVY